MTLGIDGLQRAVTVVRQYNAETGEISNSSKTFTQSFAENSRAADNFAKILEKAQNAITSNKIGVSIASVTSQFDSLGTTGHEKLIQIQTDIQTLNSLQQTMNNSKDNSTLVESYQQFEQVLSRVKNNLSIVTTATREQEAAAKKAAAAQNTMTKSATLSNNIQTWMNQNVKAAQLYGDELRRLQSILANNTNPSQLTAVSAQFAKIKSEAKAAGLVANQFATSIKNVGLQVLGLNSGVAVIRKLISTIKEGINTVVEMDTALVDLKKTTTMSGADLSAFYKDANQAAKELGVTTTEIIQAASDWSRLG